MSLTSTASADSFGTGTNQFDIDFVTIPGSVGDGYGGQSANSSFTTTNIPHDYRIGVYEVTNDQWNKFQAELGVPVTGTPSDAYNESPTYTGTNVPTNEVSWYEAAQFVNWLNTSSGHQAAYKFTGTQGTSGYTFATWSAAEADNGTNLYRHKDAFYYLPTEDEWVKAGYWNGTSLQTYATKPGDMVHQGDGVSGTGWNYLDDDYGPDGPTEGLWDVGSGSEELNGTYDLMGNVWEWIESPDRDPSFGTDTNRVLRGSTFRNDDYYLASSSRFFHTPILEVDRIGFRVASEVPAADPIPAPLAVVAGGFVGLFGLMRRR